MTIAEKLKRFSQTHNMSAIARATGVSRTCIGQICKGSQPRASVAVRLARALGVDVAWLIDDTAEWPPVRNEAAEPPTPDRKQVHAA